MTRRLTWLAVIFAGVVAVAHPVTDLVGVWEFQKEISTKADGSVADVPAVAYDGLLIYTADGHVSVIVMPKGRKWNAETATLQELRDSIVEGAATGYAGRYEVDAKAGTVTHILAVSLDPGDHGQRLVRHYTIKGDTLTLSGNWSYQGAALRFTVYWKRAKPATK